MKQAKEITKKLRSVRSIQHITRAMKMVAGAKLRKAQARLEAIHPYSHRVDTLLLELLASLSGYQHPFLQPGPENAPVLLAVVASDKGLCGSFNSNIVRDFEEIIRQKRWLPSQMRIVSIGSKGAENLRRAGLMISAEFNNPSASPPMKLVEEMANALIEPFTQAEVRAVDLILPVMQSSSQCAVRQIRLLPFPEADTDPALEALPMRQTSDFIFDPDRKRMADFLMPRVALSRFYNHLVHAIVAEHSMRMISMENATEKAGEMIDELTLTLNKARQESITLELLDIVGGAEALRSAV